MSEVVYNENLVKTEKNKYRAVNIIAQRARDINANGLPFAPSSTTDKKKKPVAVATEELVEGKLRFKKTEENVPVSKTPSIFTDPEVSDDEDGIFDEELIEHGQDTEMEEREEGL